ncbi:uncharacterized protein N7473_010475 [Penicillium subrubescens]|uniref:Uncharacterized protein n=1 Tax=Penicillium subrubescens TaxID=1316194 RepID=A0A1Q5SZ84_9EURO|nr:uncharacterized protein N7473_010475 [Penicillium subrubescens]KAJ5883589.1 hypothetical protein N7473_010475 [Penicillium subrubescens]OKO93339.1 hypothetical protein PENSUB_12402 [Penicillium subrubescens]
MQLTSILGLCLVGLATSAAAMPRIAGPYHGKPLAVHVPVNLTTTANKASTTGSLVKKPLTTGAHHSPQMQNSPNLPNHIKHINHCTELCSLEAQTCNIAVPDDDKFW